MANSFPEFSNRMRLRAGKFEGEANKEIANLAIDLVADLAHNTPVRSGQAAGNWLVSEGGPLTGYTPGPSSPDISVAKAKAALANYRGGTIHIVNNVPYIAELNAGSSLQAPALFVQSAVLRAQYRVKQISIKL